MRRIDPSRLERTIGRVLLTGAVASAVLLAAGLAWKFAAPASPVSDLLLSAGLIVLMATPVARVVVSVVEFAMARDWLFTAITSAVLVVLLGSLLYALR